MCHRHAVAAAGGGGVVHQDVDAAQLAARLVDQALHLVGVGDVDDEGKGAAAEGADLLPDRIDVAPAHRLLLLRVRLRRAAGAGDGDVGALAGERQRYVAADAVVTSGAGDDSDLAFEGRHSPSSIAFP